MNKVASQTFSPKDFSVGLVQEMLITLGKLGFSPNMAKSIVNVSTGIAEEIVKICGKEKLDYNLNALWRGFYKTYFNLDLDFSELLIPKRPNGDWRLLIIAKGMTPEKLFQKCKEIFNDKAYKERAANFDDVIKSVRSPKDVSYAIWVKQNQEADKELKNLSALDIEIRNIDTETLEEHLIHELIFFYQTSQHLDVDNITLCSGSRFGVDGVPRVDFSNRLRVRWCSLDFSDDDLCARGVVS